MVRIKCDRNDKYNNQPVHYCIKCESLDIRVSDEGKTYCNKCGNTVTSQTDIFTWLENSTDNNAKIKCND